jgi:hypothetical protein
MGVATAKAIEEMIKSAADRSAGKAKPRSSTLNRLVRARLASLGLVLTSGFLLTVSLAVSAALEGLSQYLQGLFPGANVTLKVFDFLVSTTLISAMFAAIYKALPDKPITWRDVAIGAVVTTLLFDAGGQPVLILHGTADDNVYFLHSLKISDTLFRAGIAHGFIPLEGYTHMLADPEMTREVNLRILAHFTEHLQERSSLSR